jgi:hypothetical protein
MTCMASGYHLDDERVPKNAANIPEVLTAHCLIAAFAGVKCGMADPLLPDSSITSEDIQRICVPRVGSEGGPQKALILSMWAGCHLDFRSLPSAEVERCPHMPHGCGHYLIYGANRRWPPKMTLAPVHVAH